jgi:LCP family protein required for cell wall assembly
MRPPSRHPSRRRGPGWVAVTFLLLTASLAGLGAGMLGGEQAMTMLGLAPAPSAETIGATPAPPPKVGLMPQLSQAINVLFMATDVDVAYKDGKRVMGMRGRTDTMMVARLDPGADQVRLLSIPRDTRVSIPGHGHNKINAANPYGGPELASQVAAEFLGIPVDRYLLVNTRGVIQLVDALGGVDVFVPKDLHYDDWTGKLHIHLNKGMNRLDGQKAHDFLRFRHDDQGDIGRVQRQQAFLQALLKQYMTPMNLLKTPQLLAAARENLVTNLTQEELLQIVGWGRGLKQEQVQLAMVPGRDALIGGGWYWVADEVGTRRVVASFLTGEEVQSAKAPQAYRVAILDGVGDRPAVRRLRQALVTAGYATVELDGAAPEQGQRETQIIATNADVAGARAVADALGLGKVVVAATGNLRSDFTIVMGRDWTTREAAPQATTP